MSTYCFITGIHPYLTYAEVLGRYGESSLVAYGEDFIEIKSDQEIGQLEFDQLGGSMKAGRVLQTVKKNDIVEGLAEELVNFYKGSKLDYGLSIYGVSEKQLRFILLKLKKLLRAKEIKSRFINKDFKNISAAQYKSIKGRGVELMLIKRGGDFEIAEAIGVQNIDAYSKRDYEKPRRDMEMGMMPPKLAQILINLTGTNEAIWDPFCGGGTLVMEGLLMGRQMIGSDINQKHIADAETNIDWLIDTFKIQSSEFYLFTHDATKSIEDLGVRNQLGGIAFEGYLGDPHGFQISQEELNKIIVQLNQLYVQFFNQLKEIQFKGPIVSALPYFILSDGKEIFMDRLLDQLTRMGFQKFEFLPDQFKLKDPTCLKYSRKGQAVGRAIYKFELTPNT